jgi:hypothetical protein
MCGPAALSVEATRRPTSDVESRIDDFGVEVWREQPRCVAGRIMG